MRPRSAPDGSTPMSASNWPGDLVERATGMGFAAYLDEALRAARPHRDLAARVARARRRVDGRRPRPGRSRTAAAERASSPQRHSLTRPPCSSPACAACCPASARRTTTTGVSASRSARTKSPHWTGSHNSPQTYGHFGQGGTMLWIDPVARLGTRGAHRSRLRPVGRRGVARAGGRRPGRTLNPHLGRAAARHAVKPAAAGPSS